jgi:transposase-like protein
VSTTAGAAAKVVSTTASARNMRVLEIREIRSELKSILNMLAQ